MGVAGEETWRELNGEHILDLETPAARQSLQHTRTFKHPITDAATLHSLLVDFAVQVGIKLRKERSAALQICVFVATDRFSTQQPYVSRLAYHRFEVATADARELAAAVGECLSSLQLNGLPVKRAGVGASLIEHNAVQGDLFDIIDRDKQQRLQAVVDNLHAVIGEHSLAFGFAKRPLFRGGFCASFPTLHHALERCDRGEMMMNNDARKSFVNLYICAEIITFVL